MLGLPAAAVLGMLFLAPLAIFTVYAFYRSGFFVIVHEFTLANFQTIFSSALVAHLVWNSVQIGFITGVVCLVLGLPVAYFVRYRAGRLEYVLLLLLILSMFTSYLARIFSWYTIFSVHGVLNVGLQSIGLPPVHLLFTKWAVIIALVHIFTPYVAVTAYAAMRNLPREVLDVAADLGAGPLATWRRVLLPLLAPAIATPFLFTFVLAASDFATPQLMGGTGGNMIGSYIQQTFTDAGDYPLGAAISLVMLVLFLLVYAAVALLLRGLGLSRIPTVY